MLKNPTLFRQNFRMSPDIFFSLLRQVETSLKPKLHARPDSLLPELKLALTLEYVVIIKTSIVICMKSLL